MSRTAPEIEWTPPTVARRLMLIVMLAGLAWLFSKRRPAAGDSRHGTGNRRQEAGDRRLGALCGSSCRVGGRDDLIAPVPEQPRLGSSMDVPAHPRRRVTEQRVVEANGFGRGLLRRPRPG